MTGCHSYCAALRKVLSGGLSALSGRQGLPASTFYRFRLHIFTSTVSGCHGRGVSNRAEACGALISCPSFADSLVWLLLLWQWKCDPRAVAACKSVSSCLNVMSPGRNSPWSQSGSSILCVLVEKIFTTVEDLTGADLLTSKRGCRRCSVHTVWVKCSCDVKKMGSKFWHPLIKLWN